MSVRRVISAMLKRKGHQTTDVSSMQHCMEELRRKSYDLIVTDILMPEHDGLELIRAVMERTPWVPIVAISGGGRIAGRDYLKIAKGLGAAGVLEKPFELEALFAVLEPFLETSGLPSAEQPEGDICG